MRILNFKAENLFSLGNVELALDKRGLLLVTGHSNDEGGANGSGKSSLSNKGLLWTLFGSTASGDKADAVINRFAEEDATCSGSVDVESNNGGKFRIIRSRRPNRLTLIDLATNTDISCKLEKETQTLVDGVLGRTKETFLQTDFFGQGKAANFLDLTPKAQTELLESVLPFDALTKLAEDTKGYLTKLKVVEASVERHVATENGKMLEAQRQERELSTSIDVWETKHLETIDFLNAEIAKLQADNPVLARIEQLKTLVAELPARAETEQVITALRISIDNLEGLRREWDSALHQWKARIPTDIVEPKQATCPTCEQGISIDKYNSLYNSYMDKLADALRSEDQVATCIRTIDKITESIADHRARLVEAELNIKKLDKIDLEVAQLEATRNNDNLAILQQKLETVQAEINPYEELYSNNASTLKSVTSTLSHHKSRLTELATNRQALEFWYTAFSKDLKNEFLNQVCPFLETKANLHLEGMGNGQIKVKVSTTKTLKTSDEKSEFTVSVASKSGASSYEGLSGGEKQMANFAFGLALADLAEIQVEGPSFFMVLDEPFVSLDARNSEHLVGYLTSYLSGKKETILLVSNEESLKALIPNRIRVIKENGITRLEDERT